MAASLPLPPATDRVRFAGTAGTPFFPHTNTAANGVGLFQADMSLDTVRFAKDAPRGPRCACTNGVPKIGSACPATSAPRCASCNAGYVFGAWIVESTAKTTALIVPYDGNGSATDMSATVCRACPAGQFAANTWTCVACEAGRYANKPGMAACTECPVASGGYGAPTGATSAADCWKCSSTSMCRSGNFCNVTVGPAGACTTCTGASSCGCTQELMPNYDALAQADDGSCAHAALCATNRTACYPRAIDTQHPCADGVCSPPDYTTLERVTAVDSKIAFRFVAFKHLKEETTCRPSGCHKPTPAVTPLVLVR
eukprot:COSAG01_NODE_14960_length_1391_cov_1.140867_2_plen_312_part_01